MMMDIPATYTPQQLYGVYLEWDHPDTSISLEISDQITRRLKQTGVSVDDRAWGPCWSHQLCISGTSETHVRRFVEKVLRLLKRRRAELHHLGGLITTNKEK